MLTIILTQYLNLDYFSLFILFFNPIPLILLSFFIPQVVE